MTASSFTAPAKLNLMLLVTGHRADGYHELQTVFRFIDYSDTLHFSIRRDGRIARTRDLPGVTAEGDLTLRAAQLLQRESGTPLGVDITLDKRLPLGGGLGGGSSDAATTLLALNVLWRLGLPRLELQTLALELGADVPVFVFGQNAVGEGVGEKLRPVELPAAWYVVLIPQVNVGTASIFQDPDLKRDSNPIRIPPFSVSASRNDLEPVVVRLYPEVARHIIWLGQFGDARLTGSGACVFAEFSTEAAALAAYDQLPQTMKGIVARGLAEHPLRALGD